MAECLRFKCGNCTNKIDAWSDGTPYYLDENGYKQYAHHPEADFDLCIGNDIDFLCLGCGKKFRVDSNNPDEKYPKCRLRETSDWFELDGKNCPKARKGNFLLPMNSVELPE